MDTEAKNEDLPKSSRDEYFDALRTWTVQAQVFQNAVACFPMYLASTYPQLFQPRPAPGFVAQANSANPARVNRTGDEAQDLFANQMQLRNEQIINQNGGYEYIIAPFWKRIVAEIIDVAILFLLKLLLTFAVVDIFDINLGIDFDFDAFINSLEDDYTELLSFTSELLVLEIVTKIGVCFYEAIWTMQGQSQMGGATPGKILMGLRLLHVTAVVPLDPPQRGLNLNNSAQLRALLFPAANPGFKRAFCRAVAKNILMALFFPMCFIMFLFKHNRTSYDIMTKTIVVEENAAPILRR